MNAKCALAADLENNDHYVIAISYIKRPVQNLIRGGYEKQKQKKSVEFGPLTTNLVMTFPACFNVFASKYFQSRSKEYI